MLTLYGNLESGNVYKVRLILALTGRPYRAVDVSQVRGDPTHAGLSRRQSHRQGPGGEAGGWAAAGGIRRDPVLARPRHALFSR